MKGCAVRAGGARPSGESIEGQEDSSSHLLLDHHTLAFIPSTRSYFAIEDRSLQARHGCTLQPHSPNCLLTGVLQNAKSRPILSS